MAWTPLPVGLVGGPPWPPGDEDHLNHHDVIHEVLNGDLALPGLLVGNVPDGAIPRSGFVTNITLDADAPGTDRDWVAHVMISTIINDFTGKVGPSGRWAWGQNIFTITGDDPGDGNGLDYFYGSLIEVAVRSDATITAVIGLEAGSSFYGAESNGATVALMASIQVSAPKAKAGASGGTLSEVYGVKIEAVPAGWLGAAVAHPLWVGFGESYFEGSIVAGSGVAIPQVSPLLLGSIELRDDNSGNLNLNGAGILAGPFVSLGSYPVRIQTGTGSPEGVHFASVGSLYLRTDGGASTTLYVKQSGNLATGWAPK